MSATDTEIAAIAAGLSKAQRKALLAFEFPERTFETVMQGVTPIKQWATASVLGVSGRALSSMNGLGGVDPSTMLLGPILVTPDFDNGGSRYWSMTATGLAVRAHLAAQTKEQDNG